MKQKPQQDEMTHPLAEFLRTLSVSELAAMRLDAICCKDKDLLKLADEEFRVREINARVDAKMKDTLGI